MCLSAIQVWVEVVLVSLKHKLYSSEIQCSIDWIPCRNSWIWSRHCQGSWDGATVHRRIQCVRVYVCVRTGTCKYLPACVCTCRDLCIRVCLVQTGTVRALWVPGEAFWEACENAVKMSRCSWHRTGLMDCLHSQRCLYVCVVKSHLDWILSRDTQGFHRRCQRPTTSLLL